VIHYHGTPITPRRELLKLGGRHFCVSFEDSRDADTCRAIGQSVMWDNGAFSTFTRGAEFDVPGFLSWVEPRLSHPHWAVIPDVIGGNVEAQRALLAQWPFSRQLGAPVWHLDKPIDYLLELADEWPRICWGSAGAYWRVLSPDWCRRADEAWVALERHGARPWVHMLRGMACGEHAWPFASVDSTNVARNHAGSHRQRTACPALMADRIDRQNGRGTWTPPVEQMEIAL